MTGRLTLSELLAKAGDGDRLRGVADSIAQLLMGMDVALLQRRRPVSAPD
jgi:hypothetical protein